MRVGKESPDEEHRNDLIVLHAVRHLQASGFLPFHNCPLSEFGSVSKKVNQTFNVDVTAITTRMARLLYAIGRSIGPKLIVTIGSYQGNSTIWLAAGAGPHAKVIGIDPDQKANEIARGNFARFGLNNIDVVLGDGHDIQNFISDTVDLVLLDADDPERGKENYSSLVDAVWPVLTPGGTLLAHDVCWPKFQNDLVQYKKLTYDITRFTGKKTVAIDQFGLDIVRRAE
ncbi:hypothetical protein RvVAR0630_18460 [Agrobacterium vitis]|uniref:O-methyltransferase n=1 Tax=Agrobacterium vitis TaxID=373 RepID=UPI0015D7C9D7|nr:class I SAM-dependent methyltransferase [Agrobacterium vitis]BCH59222.1 hypothetical protein RvVAR0630_18460 [Agrobacterium vitis]